MPKQTVKSLSNGRCVVIGEGAEQTTWSGLTDSLNELVYGMLHTQEPSVTISKTDAYYLAGIVESYEALVYANREKRNRVCSAIRQEAEKIERSRNRCVILSLDPA